VLNRVSRADFNRIAAEQYLPVYWTQDKNQNGTLDADELQIVWGVGRPGPTGYDYEATQRVFRSDKGELTDGFYRAYALIASAAEKGGDRSLLQQELAQGRGTLVASDLRALAADEKTFVRKIMAAADITERLYQRQKGTVQFWGQLPRNNPAAFAVMFRNQGPRCEGPRTQNEAGCSAIADLPKSKLTGMYPEGLAENPKFCDELNKNADKSLVDPFTVVRKTSDGKLTAVPYTTVYKDEMAQIARLLDEAAEVLKDPKEEPLRNYLRAAAKSFVSNDWVPADEAWAKMGVDSKWYLRIAPDETYGEPCNVKAMFHVSFARINQKSLAWQSKLDPLKTEMEQALAKQAGAPYKARKVSFKLPDFIDVVLNTGDSRPSSGVTIGQSLPNFGPVANQGRGRTVAMTNFYADPDSLAAQRETSESLFCASVMPKYTTDPEPQLMSTVLHEAAHNLGPAHQYAVRGKIDRDVFGGPLASTFEELKAQTAALYFTDWLVAKNQITKDDADRAHVRDLAWAFGHISRGMYTESGQPKSYSQLAAIQLGYLMKAGVVTWKQDELAANGKDKGCLAVDLGTFAGAADKLMKEVAGIKGRGDKPGAQKLVTTFVDCKPEGKGAKEAGEQCTAVQKTITERVLRQPKASFLYAVQLD